MRVFVAWDFTDPRAQKVLEAVREFGCGPLPDGRELRWTIPGQREQEESGPIGSALVARNIIEADVVMALVDRANANVGWEIGLALGWGKQLRLGAVSSSPAFRLGALAGQLVTRVETWQDVCKLVAQKDWTFTVTRPEKLDGVTCVLCPSGPEGAGLREALQREGIDGVELSEPLTEKLQQVPAFLARARRLIWVVTLHADEGSRDGDENASNAVVAGLAHAAGWEVTAMQSSVARRLVDVAADSVEFSGIKDFVTRVRRKARALVAAEAQPPPVRRAAPVAIALLSHFEQQRLLGELQRLFSDRATIKELAASVGVDRLPSSRAPDRLWGGVLRALSKSAGDLGPLVQAGLDVEPDNAVLAQLRDGSPVRV